MPSAVLAIILSHPRGGLRMTLGVHPDYSPLRRLGDLTIDAWAAASLVRFMQSGDRHYDTIHLAGHRYEMVVHLHKTPYAGVSIRMAAPGKGGRCAPCTCGAMNWPRLARNLPPIWAWTLLPPWQRHQHRRPRHHLTSS